MVASFGVTCSSQNIYNRSRVWRYHPNASLKKGDDEFLNEKAFLHLWEACHDRELNITFGEGVGGAVVVGRGGGKGVALLTPSSSRKVKRSHYCR